MKKRVVQYVTEPSGDISPFQRRLYKEHASNLVDVRKSLEFDIRHGVTKEEVMAFLAQLKNDPAIRKKERQIDVKARYFGKTLCRFGSCCSGYII